MTLAAVDIAWLAGFLEGEGTFQITEDASTAKRGPYIYAQLAATNTSKDLLERCKEIAGGYVYGPNGRGDARWKPSYRWTLGGPKLGPLLEALMPFLVSKREHALILLALRRETRDGARPGRWGRRRKTEVTIARRREYKGAMHALNHRGGGPIPDEHVAALTLVRMRLGSTAPDAIERAAETSTEPVQLALGGT